jgi:DNA-binding beta-propeller fold protein YncE
MDWAKLPEGWSFLEVVDVAVDSKDQVYVFNRGKHPVIVFDREGRFLSSWGEGQFIRPHGITIGPDDMLYCTDDDAHAIYKFTIEGKLLMTIGTPGKAAPFQSGKPFNRPTNVAVDWETADLYISDGYGNSRIHKYSPDGKHLFSWGQSGTDPGEFNLVHSVCTDKDGYVYVADRENHRVQIFDSNGKFVTQWHDMHRPCGLHINNSGKQLVYIGELGSQLAINEKYPNLGLRISIYSLNGDRLSRFGDIRWGEGPHQFIAPHGIASDSQGNLYVGEASYAFVGRKLSPPRELPCFRKLVKVI